MAVQDHLNRGLIKATYYRRGAVVTGWPSRWPSTSGERIHRRGIIRNATVRTLIRAGFAIANAPVDFDLMTTLTFRERPAEAKKALRAFCSSETIKPMLGAAWGWVQEFQERGVVHYHLLHTKEALAGHWEPGDTPWRTVGKGKRARTVLGGLAEQDIAEEWMSATGDNSYKSHRYNFGGITEVMRDPAAAGAYLGNYFSKMGQKQLPEDEPPQGRWWWLHPSLAAKPIGESILLEWPFDRPHHLVFDKRKLPGSDLPFC